MLTNILLRRFCRVVGAGAAEVDGDLILVSPVDRRCFSLNGTAAAVWGLLPVEGGLSVGDLVQRLIEIYSVEAETCEAEVIRLIQAMAEAGVVSSTS